MALYDHLATVFQFQERRAQIPPADSPAKGLARAQVELDGGIALPRGLQRPAQRFTAPFVAPVELLRGDAVVASEFLQRLFIADGTISLLDLSQEVGWDPGLPADGDEVRPALERAQIA